MSTHSSRIAARIMVAPSVAVLLIWMVVPLVMTLYYSFRIYRLLSPDRNGWAGIRNYSWFVESPDFWVAMGNTLALVGGVLVRRSGVYLAMLSLALAQVIWAGASQWVGLTGGDNGLIGLTLIAPESRAVFDVALLAGVLAAVAMLGRWSVSSRGAALQALRDAPLRAAASGLPVNRLRYQVFVLSAALAGLAGGLWAAIKGAVFPSVASVGTSVDALLVILLGGVHQLWGALVGSALLVWGGAELGQGLDYWRGVLGLLIMAVMVLSPSGVLGGLQSWWLSRRRPA